MHNCALLLDIFALFVLYCMHALIFKNKPCLLFLRNNIKLDGIAKLNKKYLSVLDHDISSFEVISYLIKSYKIQLPVPLIVVILHQLSHQQISFSTTFYLKKIFVMNFPFLTDSPKLSHPLSSQNLLNMTSFLSMLPQFLHCIKSFHGTYF